MDLIPGQVISRTLKMALAALSLGAQHSESRARNQNWSTWCQSSRKHAYIILTPLNPIFYIVKLGFTGVYIIFLISAKNIDYGYSLELPWRGGSNEYPQSMFRAEI